LPLRKLYGEFGLVNLAASRLPLARDHATH
jgi:hypothetical protein